MRGLHAVQRSLDEIEHLQPPPGQELAINAIKVAALLCQHPLNDFAKKLAKYEALGQVGGKKKEQVKKWRLKLQWGLTMEEEVQKIRVILAAHMASLNVRISTYGLTSASVAAQNFNWLHDGLSHTHNAVLEIEKATQSQNLACKEANIFLQTLLSLVQHKLLPKMIDIANRLWTSNVQILNLLKRIQYTNATPDVQYTYFQAPCQFEDALGRPLIVPSEYDLNMLRAIISARLSSGPGRDKVQSGEYEIFNTYDNSQLPSESNVQSMTMKPEADVQVIQDHTYHPMPSSGTSMEDDFDLNIPELVAAQAIQLVLEEIYMNIGELKELTSASAEPGGLGFDSLMAVSTTWRFQELGIEPPTGHRFYDPLFLESFIRKLGSQYGHVMDGSYYKGLLKA
ncbi:MAG: hypothetical protein Q9209_005248 [Squamulea sp. 1 TL-2023]